MRNYLKDVIEWCARKILARAAVRATEMLMDLDDTYNEAPRALPEPRLPLIGN